MEWKKDIAQEMVLYQTRATLNDVQEILVRLLHCNYTHIMTAHVYIFFSVQVSVKISLILLAFVHVLQNTREKFSKEPEECDPKEMYKLLVSLFQSIYNE